MLLTYRCEYEKILEDLLKENQKENWVKVIDSLTKIWKLNLEKAKINILKTQEKQKYQYDLKNARSDLSHKKQKVWDVIIMVRASHHKKIGERDISHIW